jgi:hypothetical protein
MPIQKASAPDSIIANTPLPADFFDSIGQKQTVANAR